jgi:hypothetical protein
MSSQYSELDDKQIAFIAAQHLFFVGTAAESGRVNLSPKGRDSLKVLGPNKLLWLNLTGSGNETAAHLQRVNRMTVMICSYDKQPLILRLYGTAKTIHPRDAQWQDMIGQFPETTGARQIYEMEIEMVQTSCGFAVPHMDFISERDTLKNWATKQGPTGIEAYWKKKNQTSLDGFETGVIQ